MKTAKTPHARAYPASVPFVLPEPFPFIDMDVIHPGRIRVRVLPESECIALPDDIAPEEYYQVGSVAVVVEHLGAIPDASSPALEPERNAATRGDRPAILAFPGRASRAAL